MVLILRNVATDDTSGVRQVQPINVCYIICSSRQQLLCRWLTEWQHSLLSLLNFGFAPVRRRLNQHKFTHTHSLSHQLRHSFPKVFEISYICWQILNAPLLPQCLFPSSWFPSFLLSESWNPWQSACLTGNQTGYDTLIEDLTSLSEEKKMLWPRLVPSDKSAYGKNCSPWSTQYVWHILCIVNSVAVLHSIN